MLLVNNWVASTLHSGQLVFHFFVTVGTCTKMSMGRVYCEGDLCCLDSKEVHPKSVL